MHPHQQRVVDEKAELRGEKMKSELELTLYDVNKKPKKQYSFTDKEREKIEPFIKKIKADCRESIKTDIMRVRIQTRDERFK